MRPLITLLAVSVLAASALLAGCGTADSQQAEDRISWTHPTTREGGAALPISQIKHTLVSWGPQGGPYIEGSVTVASPAAAINVPRPVTPGTRCYVARTVDTENRMSVESAAACKTILAPPNSPIDVTVE